VTYDRSIAALIEAGTLPGLSALGLSLSRPLGLLLLTSP
jgi:hypothetical protein